MTAREAAETIRIVGEKTGLTLPVVIFLLSVVGTGGVAIGMMKATADDMKQTTRTLVTGVAENKVRIEIIRTQIEAFERDLRSVQDANPFSRNEHTRYAEQIEARIRQMQDEIARLKYSVPGMHDE